MTLQFYSNETDTVIAESEEDAVTVWEETTGEKWEWYEDELNRFELLEKEPDELITIVWVDDEPTQNDVPDGGRIEHPGKDSYYRVVATAEQWIEKNGRGFFSSTEW